MIDAFKYEQSVSNFVAFISAVTFSFFVNSKLTFKKRPTTTGYMIYIGIMGFLSILSGYVGDRCNTSPMFMLISFSVISLVIGYFSAKHLVFKDNTALLNKSELVTTPPLADRLLCDPDAVRHS
ncbi:GtrA family protein [Sodalis glossinidius]|uniref:GtrA family protein n=1 Tax=Sodalis glossinidius TaxID=63612 RepID=UPI001FB13DDC|nr:GtrA family protein [Sodalis glossinidius]